ncbi:MAG: hypothetical protein K1X88_24795 [Nannocystaceae bacterium]|nr:hypothetical protein [Nannocystaceae bacterium]
MNLLRSLFGLSLGLLASFGCAEDDAPPLEPVRDCHSDEECVAADDRFDRCQWVCEAHVTYCQPSCEQDSDCRGRGLPDDFVFCDIPRPGEGFCNAYGYAYKPNACVQEVPPLPGHDGSG